MNKKNNSRKGALALILALAIGAAGPVSAAKADTVPTDGSENSAANVSYTANSYAAVHAAEGYSLTGERVSVLLNTASGDGLTITDQYEGRTGPVLLTEAESEVTVRFSVPKTGRYRLQAEYYPIAGSARSIQREIRVDGELSFSEAACIEFARVFKDGAAAGVGTDGEELRPKQVEAPRWISAYCRDTLGYYGDLYWNLSAGEHTLTLRGLCEPMAIASLTFCSDAGVQKSYADYVREARDNGAEVITGVIAGGTEKYQAENMLERSAQTLYAQNDKSSPATEPFSYTTSRLNMVGGTKWNTADQWISWEITVPQTGLYRLGCRYRQNTARGVRVHRELSIDGEVPFTEAGALVFPYHNDWHVITFGDGGQDFLFYLTEGKHTLTLRVVLGELADILGETQQILSDLNEANWSLMTVLGSNPDKNRDYELDKTMPEVIRALAEASDRLNSVADSLESATGQNDQNTAMIRQFALLLHTMSDTPHKIAANYSGFKDNIGALGDTILNMRAQPLALDYLLVAEERAALPKANAGFFQTFYYQSVLFFRSFIKDYALVGSDGDASEQEPVVVWIGSGATGGRDQAQALNRMIREEFLPAYHVPVQLQLTASGTILVATLAGMGPDVALQIGGSDPVDYAMRHAVYDLTSFDDFAEVSARFTESALTPFRYNGGVYALPETQSYYVMFYRRDILARLGIDPGELNTWDDLINVLGDLQENNLSVALPANYITYYMFLTQMGGTLYKNDGQKSALDEEIAVQAFKLWTNFYVNYQLPVEYSFVNRFRLGEMPIGIDDYTTYNLLSVSAPEIAGSWDIAPLPGVRRSDGTVNNASPSSSSGAVIMSGCANKPGAWEFLKWWTGAEVQKEFGDELESIMGAAARYNTANTEASDSLSWSADDLKTLKAQRAVSQGIPQVPGGYYTTRYIEFAMRLVVNRNDPQRDTLLKYVPTINEEIALRRKEFELDQ